MFWKLNFIVTLYLGVPDLKLWFKLNILLMRNPRETENPNDLFHNKLKLENNRVPSNHPWASFFIFLCIVPGPARWVKHWPRLWCGLPWVMDPLEYLRKSDPIEILSPKKCPCEKCASGEHLRFCSHVWGLWLHFLIWSSLQLSRLCSFLWPQGSSGF